MRRNKDVQAISRPKIFNSLKLVSTPSSCNLDFASFMTELYFTWYAPNPSRYAGKTNVDLDDNRYSLVPRLIPCTVCQSLDGNMITVHVIFDNMASREERAECVLQFVHSVRSVVKVIWFIIRCYVGNITSIVNAPLCRNSLDHVINLEPIYRWISSTYYRLLRGYIWKGLNIIRD